MSFLFFRKRAWVLPLCLFVLFFAVGLVAEKRRVAVHLIDGKVDIYPTDWPLADIHLAEFTAIKNCVKKEHYIMALVNCRTCLRMTQNTLWYRSMTDCWPAARARVMEEFAKVTSRITFIDIYLGEQFKATDSREIVEK